MHARRTLQQCGVILLNKSLTKVLCVLQRHSMKWGLPKGHMTDDELMRSAYFECAKRELYEETGMYVHFVKFKVLGTLVLHDKFFFIMHLKKDVYAGMMKPVDKNEIVRTKWVSLARIPEYIMTVPCNSTLHKLAKNMHYVMRWCQPATVGSPPHRPFSPPQQPSQHFSLFSSPHPLVGVH